MTIKAEYRRLEARKKFRRYRCRCSACEHRATFRQNPRQMRKDPRCATCGSQRWRVDWYRTTRREHQRVKCHCGAYPYPHRRGSCGQQSMEQAMKIGRRAA
jgi:hypothetical protein